MPLCVRICQHTHVDRQLEHIMPPTQSVGCVRRDNSNDSIYTVISASVMHVLMINLLINCSNFNLLNVCI